MTKNNNVVRHGTHTIAAAAFLIFSATCQATPQVDEGLTLQLGSPSDFIATLQLENITKHAVSDAQIPFQATQQASQKHHFNLMTATGDALPVVSSTLFEEATGALSIDGHIIGNEESRFVLQGDSENLSGWVILTQQDIAYQYTTVDGVLEVTSIDIEQVYPSCDLTNHHDFAYASHGTHLRQAFPASMAGVNREHLGSYPGSDVSRLESKPDSEYVILLDTRRIMSNGVPYDVSKEFIWTTWQIVAASLSMLDVNVTTDWNVYNRAVPSKRGGATMYRESGRSSCYYAFGTSTFCTLYRETDAYGQGRIAAHEIGHLLHLAHDGGAPGGEYHNGIADYQWVPVMGNVWSATSWPDALYQWSKGEYSGATNRENDFNIINRFIPFKKDDNSNGTALNIGENGVVSAAQNQGQIERSTDVDRFTFSLTEAGRVNLNIDRSEHIGGGMLDVSARLVDQNGSVIAQSNHNVARSASFDINLAAGQYALEILAGAEGTPYWGFSNYSSLGYYAIEGSISGASGGEPRVPSLSNVSPGQQLSGSEHTFTWQAGDAQGFWFYAGSSPGAQDYYRNETQINDTRHTVSNLPTDGSEVHITFHYLLDQSWQQSNYRFQAANDDPSGDTGITSPALGEILSGTSQTFTWLPGDAQGFWLYAGSSQGAQDYYRNESQINGNQHTVTNLPVDGSTVHITFHFLQQGTWQQRYYSYTAATDIDRCTAMPDTPEAPTNQSLSSRSFSARWPQVASANTYQLQLWQNNRWIDQGETEQTEFTFEQLTENSTQYVRVAASNRCGQSDFSNWSQVVLTSNACNAKPDVPSGLTSSGNTLTWQGVDNAIRYNVQYWTGEWNDYAESETTRINVTLSGRNYLRVNAINACGESDYSAYITIN